MLNSKLYAHSAKRFFKYSFLISVIGILQLATPKGAVGVSTVACRKASTITNNPPFPRKLRKPIEDFLFVLSCPIGQVLELDWMVSHNHDVSGSDIFNLFSHYQAAGAVLDGPVPPMNVGNTRN